MAFEYLTEYLNIKLKLDYLKNKKSFRSEIKTIFFVSQVVSFRLAKHIRKIVADTTSKDAIPEGELHEEAKNGIGIR